MIRAAACLWLGVLFVPSLAPAAGQTFEAMVTAQAGEGEVEACAKARAELHSQSVAFLVGESADLRSYHSLLDAYTWQGRSRAELDQDIGANLGHLEVTEVSRFWSGKSCLLRGYVDLDLAPVLDAMISATAMAPAGVDQSDDEISWLAMPGIAMDKFRNQRLLAEAVTELSVVKMMVAERWSSTNKWPRSLSEINLEAADFAKSEVLDQVVMGDGGVIRARLKAPLGGETLEFGPESGSMGMIRWSCVTTVAVLFGNVCSD